MPKKQQKQQISKVAAKKMLHFPLYLVFDHDHPFGPVGHLLLSTFSNSYEKNHFFLLNAKLSRESHKTHNE